MKFALPTEAQWEYACRAGTIGEFGGTGRLDDMGWYSSNSRFLSNSPKEVHRGGKKCANAWGLYDMHGNVWEWCQDWSNGDYPSGSAIDPTGASSGSLRIIRGGCYAGDAGTCRSASRGGYFQNRRDVDSLGFRLVAVQDFERKAQAEAEARKAREEAEHKARAEGDAAARRTAEESARLPAARNSSVFFPVYGITLGKTTLKEIRGLGGTSSGEFASQHVNYRALDWWDHDNDGVCESIFMTNYGPPMPPEWIRLGMDWGMSYDDWTAFFKKMGFSISTTNPILEKAPTVERCGARKTLSAIFTALSPDGRLSFRLDFSYGNANGEGYATSSRNSLYSITVEMKK